MTLLAIILGLLPGFAWIVFYLKEDLHPEPRKLIIYVFTAGILVTLVAYLAQCLSFTNLFPFKSCNVSLDRAVGSLSLIQGIIMVTLLAFIEEVLKFGAAYLAVHRNANFDEPVDAMIYMVVAALGFATVENFAIAQQILSQDAWSNIGGLGSALKAISLRFVGATLLHALASGIVGYYWAQSIRRFEAKRYLFTGIIIATVLHALFNYLIITFDDRIYTVVLLVAVGFLVIADFEKLKTRSL